MNAWSVLKRSRKLVNYHKPKNHHTNNKRPIIANYLDMSLALHESHNNPDIVWKRGCVSRRATKNSSYQLGQKGPMELSAPWDRHLAFIAQLA